MAEVENQAAKTSSVKFKPPPLDIARPETELMADDNHVRTPTTPGLSGTPRDDKQKEKKKIGHRRVDQTGEVTYKKVPTSQLMGAIQLGINNSVGALAGTPERDLLLQDFDVVDRVSFPCEGSSTTPSHTFGDFRFKSYAPIAFRYFRDLFHIKPEDFMSSLCTEPLRELSNPGASGSIFYVSPDDQFIIKTVQHKEAEFLQKLLPGYYMNLQQNPRTLLPKFFGLFCYQSLGKNVRLLVMNNLLPSTVKMHQKYDLKGSTYKRQASRYERLKASPTLKDLDFVEDHSEGLYLEAATYEALVKTISRDCLVLESFKIMDYSLLMGIHNIDAWQRENRSESGAEEAMEPSTSDAEPIVKPNPSARKVQRHKSMFSTWESIQADAAPIDLGDEYPSGGIPARNAKGERLLLFLGLIDILQNYRLLKKLEHTWKSVLHDGDTISVHRPGFYASRFQEFCLKNIFKKIPSLDMPEVKGPHRKFRNLVASYMALRSPSRRSRVKERRNTAGSVEDRHRPSSQHAEPPPLTARPDIVPSEAGGFGVTGRGSSRRIQYEYHPKTVLTRQDTSEGEAPTTTKTEKKVERLFADTMEPNRPENLLRSSSSDNETRHPEVTHL